MKKFYLLALALPLLLLSSCKDTGIYLPNPSGGAFEVLLVIDDKDYRTPAGEAIFEILNSPVPHLPQYEPNFRISRLQSNQFDNLLRTTRNIVFVVIDSTQYTQANVRFIRERWAKTQAIVNITGPNTESVAAELKRYDAAIVEFFVGTERKRQMSYLKENANRTAQEKVFKIFGGNMDVPTSLNKYKEGEDFLWMSNGSAVTRQDIVIYSFPYTDKNQLTAEYILAQRDSVMKRNIPGSFEGSYVGTEYTYDYPTVTNKRVNDAFAAETRGLWKMLGGESMGGPFISHTRVDEVNNRVVTVEGFVFAPGKDKRYPLRQVEAMVYSFKLPQDLNEVVITATKPKQESEQ